MSLIRVLLFTHAFIGPFPGFLPEMVPNLVTVHQGTIDHNMVGIVAMFSVPDRSVNSFRVRAVAIDFVCWRSW